VSPKDPNLLRQDLIPGEPGRRHSNSGELQSQSPTVASPHRRDNSYSLIFKGDFYSRLSNLRGKSGTARSLHASTRNDFAPRRNCGALHRRFTLKNTEPFREHRVA